MALVDDIGFIQSYSFKYSPRPGTPAAQMAGQVAEAAKIDRLAQLQARLAVIQENFNRACVGRSMSVLLDRRGRRPGQLLGRSPYMQPVHVVVPEALQGSIVDLFIDASHANSLSGTLMAHRGVAA